MNNQRLEKKIQHATEDIRRDLAMLLENGASNMNEGFEKIKSGTTETLSSAAKTVKKDVKVGLGQYNAKAQEYANKVSEKFGETVMKYPWVAITIGMGIGLFLGGLLKPSRTS